MKSRIYRPKEDRVIGGVCSGLAYDWNIDPLIVRVVAACLLFSPIPIFLIYILLWILIPGDKE